MSESENTDAENKHQNNSRKRLRHRKSQLYDNIMKQMEFYFSDANLSKDRFLGDLVKNDPFVPIAEFLKFNRIRSITQEVDDIVKSLKNSTFLELSEDNLKVKRKTPMMPYDADLRTVYVESIPVTASREWLERVFSDFGHVAYISLPMFKNSKIIKGFAFIEFAKPQEALKCINAFTKMGCRLPSTMAPEDLSSIKMFSIDSFDENPDTHADTKDDYEPPKKRAKKIKEKKPPKTLDLKLDESDTDKKLDTPTEENKNITTPSEEGKNTDIESKDGMTSQEEGIGPEGTPRKKKLKKRSSKEKNKALAKGEAPKGALWGLQLLPKTEWKSLRNKYLNLQRKYMKDIKMNVRNKYQDNSKVQSSAPPSVDVENVTRSTQPTESEKNIEPLERIPGVFAKEVLPEPCLDVRLTKRTIKSNIHVIHVDVKEGQTDVIIRFDSAKAAEEYCANSNNRARVLSGTDEETQWDLAELARANKRVRGRMRLLAKAAALTESSGVTTCSPRPTHIRFEDE